MSLAEANRIVDQRLGQLLYTDSSGNVWSDPGYIGPGSPTAAPAGSSSNPWASIITTGITTAGAVAAKAVTPPTYSSTINPLTGAQTITSYGATVPSSLLTSGLTTNLSSLLESPIVLIGGIALLCFACAATDECTSRLQPDSAVDLGGWAPPIRFPCLPRDLGGGAIRNW